MIWPNDYARINRRPPVMEAKRLWRSLKPALFLPGLSVLLCWKRLLCRPDPLLCEGRLRSSWICTSVVKPCLRGSDTC